MSEILASLSIDNIITYSIALAIILGTKLASPIIAHIIIYIFHKIIKAETKVVDSGFYGPIKFVICLIGFGYTIYYLEMPQGIINLYGKAFKILVILAIAKALGDSLRPDSTFFTKLENTKKFNGNEALNSFIGKVLKVIIYIVAAFIIMNDLGYDLGGLATGLGLGSAVVALAAQDFLKSLIGGFALITDKPFEIGDFIEVGDYQGTVTDITFRSTRLKEVNNAVTSMPNSVIVTEYVKNWSKLESRRLEIRLRIDLNTSTEKIENCISKLKTVLKNNENVLEETVMVHLEKIESDANIIWIVAYINTKSYVDFVQMREEINSDILKVLEKENIELVYPTQKVYMKTL